MEQETSPLPPENQPDDKSSEANAPSKISKDARSMALLSHLLGVFTSIIVPLIIWLIKKDEDPFIEDQSKEALNFQITIMLGYLAAGIVTVVTFGFGGVLFPIIMIGNLVFGIIAALKSNEGIAYHYPLTLRLIK